MMGLKALTNIVSSSSAALILVSNKINSFLQAAIAPGPNNTIFVAEKNDLKPLVFESTHPYADSLDVTTPVSVPGAKGFSITFDPETRTENNCDYMEFYTDSSRSTKIPNTEKYTGGKDGGSSNWPGMKDRPALMIEGDSFAFHFHSDGSVNDWVSFSFVSSLHTVYSASNLYIIF
jgi:hypothetical protein